MIVTDDELAALTAPPDTQPKTRPLLEVEFEALMYTLRDGPAAVSRPDVVKRLTRLSPDQQQQAIVRLIRLSPSNETVWKPKEIQALKEVSEINGPVERQTSPGQNVGAMDDARFYRVHSDSQAQPENQQGAICVP